MRDQLPALKKIARSDHADHAKQSPTKVTGASRSDLLAISGQQAKDLKRMLSLLRKADPELLKIAIACFESEGGAVSWLTRRAIGLDGKIPIEFSATKTGRPYVLALLRRIDYGVLA